MMETNICKFDKEKSTILKGVAILIMIFHHCFRDAKLFSDYAISFYPFNMDAIVKLAAGGKICVAIFAFISGYGLYLSYDNKESANKWVAKRYIKTFSGYWFIWILSAVVCQIIDGRFVRRFFGGTVADGIARCIVDFLGLGKLFGNSLMNNNWWYMSVAFVFILITPLLVKYKESIFLIMIGIIVLPQALFGVGNSPVLIVGSEVYPYILIFVMGIACAYYDLINRFINLGKTASMKLIKAIVEMVIIIILCRAYFDLSSRVFWVIKTALLPFIICLFIVEFVTIIPFLKKILYYLGIHSMNMYLVHNFFRAYYLTDFLYTRGHFVLTVLWLTGISLLLSIFIELMKKVLGYNRFINYILKKV